MKRVAVLKSVALVAIPCGVTPRGRPLPRRTIGSLTFSVNMFTNIRTRAPRVQEGQVKVVMPGGSGHIGTLLARTFQRAGHEVVVLSRSPRPAAWRVVRWDGVTLGPWVRELDGSDVVINLAGRSVNCRYTA